MLRRPALALVVALGLVSCDGSSHAVITGCTHHQFKYYGTAGCTAGFHIVIHDAPDPEVTTFSLTIGKIELLSDDLAVTIFAGNRRENLLDFRSHGFVIARRSDVPELIYDRIRIELARPSLVVGADPVEVELVHRAVEIELPEPIAAGPHSQHGIILDIDVAKSLAGLNGPLGPRGGVRFDPVVFASIQREAFSVDLRGSVLENDADAAIVTVELDDMAGEVAVLTPAADGFDASLMELDVEQLAPGDPLLVKGRVYPDGDVVAEIWIRTDESSVPLLSEPATEFEPEPPVQRGIVQFIDLARGELDLWTNPGSVVVDYATARSVRIDSEFFDRITITSDLPERGERVEVYGFVDGQGEIRATTLIAR